MQCIEAVWPLVTGCRQMTFVINHDVKTSSSLNHVGHVPVTHLDMSDCERLTDRGVQQIVSRCRLLTRLYVRRCSLLSDRSLQCVAAHCLALTDVSVAECVRVTDAGIVLLAVHLGQSLAHVSVAHCPLVGDRAIACLADRCWRLRYVNARCSGVTDLGVMRLATSHAGRRPRALDVSRCAGVTDAALLALAQGCGVKLRRLSVCGCTAVSDYGVLALARHCTQLRQLNLEDCPLVGASALAAVRDNCENCVIEHSCLLDLC